MAAALGGLAAGAYAQNQVTGDWQGELKVTPAQGLKLVFHFIDDNGMPKVTMDSPQQNAYGIAGTVAYNATDSVNVSVAAIGMNFAGRVSDGRLVGTFRQGMMSLPLTLKPKAAKKETPQETANYTTKEVTVPSVDGVKLSATVTLPKDYTVDTPAVVLVTGSGLQNRDEEVFGHKPFAVIADGLARKGIASIRYDDRGFGKSTGDGRSATTRDFATDARVAVDFMRKTEHFRCVGVLGHSEGATVAFMLGAEKVPDFIVAVGAPAVRGDSILVSQSRLMLLQNGMPQDVTDAYCDALGKIYDARIAKGKEASAAIAKEIADGWKGKMLLEQLGENLTAIIAAMENPWLDAFITYSPDADIAATKCPAFVIYGEKDTQVIPTLNSPAMERLAKTAEVREYPSLNHLMQHAYSGAVSEYSEIEETFSPEVLADIINFILGHSE